MSDALTTIEVPQISGFEGIRLSVYDDATGQPIGPGSYVQGHPTIGIGRNVGKGGPGLTAVEVRQLLADDLAALNTHLSTFPWWGDLNTARKSVIADMAFNMGLHGLLGFTLMLGFIEKEDFNGAARSMLASRWAVEVPSRAAVLARIMSTGDAS